MGSIPGVLLVHSCTVEPYLGTTGNGVESFAAAITVERCFIDTASRALTRGNAPGGTGDARTRPVAVYVPLDVDTSAMTVRSRIAWDNGAGPQEARLDRVERYDGALLPVPSHAVIRGS